MVRKVTTAVTFEARPDFYAFYGISQKGRMKGRVRMKRRLKRRRTLRRILMNLKNCPDNLRGSSPVSDNRPTLVEMEMLFLLVDGLVWSVFVGGGGDFRNVLFAKRRTL